MSYFNKLKKEIESDKKVMFSSFTLALLRTLFKGWRNTMGTCSITATVQLSDLEPVLAITFLFLPLFSTPRYMETQDVRLRQ